jgi:hypothetical protein
MTRDESGGGWGTLAGVGILLVELAVLVPGLLACLLLIGAFALPLLLPAIPLLILIALFLALRRLTRAAVRLIRGLNPRGLEISPRGETAWSPVDRESSAR